MPAVSFFFSSPYGLLHKFATHVRGYVGVTLPSEKTASNHLVTWTASILPTHNKYVNNCHVLVYCTCVFQGLVYWYEGKMDIYFRTVLPSSCTPCHSVIGLSRTLLNCHDSSFCMCLRFSLLCKRRVAFRRGKLTAFIQSRRTVAAFNAIGIMGFSLVSSALTFSVLFLWKCYTQVDSCLKSALEHIFRARVGYKKVLILSKLRFTTVGLTS